MAKFGFTPGIAGLEKTSAEHWAEVLRRGCGKFGFGTSYSLAS